jgi:hypothetical protein
MGDRVTTTTVVRHVHLGVHGIKLASFEHVFVLGAVVVGGFGLLLLLVGSRLHRRENQAQVARPGIWGVVGGLGAGKTYLLATIATQAVKAGREVHANIDIEGCHLMRSWDDFLSMPDDALAIFAEMQNWWPEDARRGPWEVESKFSQLRHHTGSCVFDTQHWMFVSVRLRRLCFGVWEGRQVMGGHVYRLYSGYNYRPGIHRKGSEMATLRIRRKRRVMKAYDTNQDVPPNVGWVAEMKAAERTIRVARAG